MSLSLDFVFQKYKPYNIWFSYESFKNILTVKNTNLIL